MLVSRRGELDGISDAFVDNQIKRLEVWTTAASAAGGNLMRWGFMVFTKSQKVNEPKSKVVILKRS